MCDTYSFALRAPLELFYRLLHPPTCFQSPLSFRRRWDLPNWRRYEPRKYDLAYADRRVIEVGGWREGMGSEGSTALIVMGIRLLALSVMDGVGNSMGLTLWFAGHTIFYLSLLFKVSVIGLLHNGPTRPSTSAGGVCIPLLHIQFPLSIRPTLHFSQLYPPLLYLHLLMSFTQTLLLHPMMLEFLQR
jgi:hypothetical protein